MKVNNNVRKSIIFIVSIIIIIAIIINYRTPFLRPESGGWSLGFGSNLKFPDNLPNNKTNIYSIANLKKYNDSTLFLADPFFIKERDSFFVFFEHQKYGKNGEIGLMVSGDGEKYTFKGTVLTEKFHLSYPHVFKYRNQIYMIPETKRANNILLYKAYNFPYDWRIIDTLVKNVKLKDPTLYLSDSLNIIVASDDNLQLFMYQSDSLFGKWSKHSRFKVTLGSEARPGGRFIPFENDLLLPIQNSSNGYGYGISLYRFKFRDNKYIIKKEINLFLKASPNIQEFSAGMHHIDIQFIDDKYYYFLDGNVRLNEKKMFNWKGPLKLNFFDLKNLIYQQCESYN